MIKNPLYFVLGRLIMIQRWQNSFEMNQKCIKDQKKAPIVDIVYLLAAMFDFGSKSHFCVKIFLYNIPFQ